MTRIMLAAALVLLMSSDLHAETCVEYTGSKCVKYKPGSPFDPEQLRAAWREMQRRQMHGLPCVQIPGMPSCKPARSAPPTSSRLDDLEERLTILEDGN